MSLYKVIVLLVFFFPLIITKEAKVNIITTSGGSTNNAIEESRRKMTVDQLPLQLLETASNMFYLVQSLRRMLKIVRKWCNFHPNEVKLGTCLANYFDIEIPGLRRKSEKFESFSDRRKSFSEKKSLEKSIVNRSHNSIVEKSFNTASELDKKLFGSIGIIFRNFYNTVKANLFYYSDMVIQNPLTTCIWNYFTKKFWIWVDTAPTD